jgi:hypothetical protein
MLSEPVGTNRAKVVEVQRWLEPQQVRQTSPPNDILEGRVDGLGHAAGAKGRARFADQVHVDVDGGVLAHV